MNWPQTVVDLGGVLIMVLTFGWYLSGRLSSIETKVNLLMDGRELVKVRMAKDAR